MVDGLSLLRSLRETLQESSTSSYMNNRTSYDYLWQAAIEFVSRTNCLRATQTITTVADQQAYTLNADFLNLYLKDNQGRFYVKYYNGSAYSFVYAMPYEELIYNNLTDSTSIPCKFAIIDDSSDTLITGAATAAGVVSGGQCTLTDTTSPPFTDASAGDTVNNTTDGSTGIVLSQTSTSALVTALFEGTNNDWSSEDAYAIQPQARLQLVFDQPPSTAGHTATVYYIQRPAPVYSDYGIYRIQPQYMNALVSYAAFLYKYRDREPNYGDAFFTFFDREVKRAISTFSNVSIQKGWKFTPYARR